MPQYETGKRYITSEVVRTLRVEVDESKIADGLYFDFVIYIMKYARDAFGILTYRHEMLEVKAIGGDISHEEILVRDIVLIDDEARFPSEEAAAAHVFARLDELFSE